MDAEEYRRKFEAGDLTEQDRIDEIIRLQKENKKLREALKYIKLCADRVLDKGDKMDNPDMWVIQQTAEKAIANG